MHRPGDVSDDLKAVAADLGHDPRRDRPGALADLAVGDHEPGEQHRLGARLVAVSLPGGGRTGSFGGPGAAGDVGLAAERGAVPGQQDRRPGADLRRDHPGVEPAFGQVQAVELDVGAGLADAVQGRHQRVQVVDHLVAVAEQRPGHAGAVAVGLEQPDQELPPVRRVAGQVAAVQPPVDVRVPQVRPLVAKPAEIGEVDAELRADPLIGDRGGPVGPGRGGHPGVGHLLDGAGDDQVASWAWIAAAGATTSRRRARWWRSIATMSGSVALRVVRNAGAVMTVSNRYEGGCAGGRRTDVGRLGDGSGNG